MTITIWVDWNDGVIYANQDELKTEWKNLVDNEADVAPMSFPAWLDLKYTPSEIWDANNDERYNVEREYNEYCETCYQDWINTYLDQQTLNV